MDISKIGIYIGAFDPVHSGDLDFIESALDQTGLDRVYFFVEPHPKYKQGVKALNHRVHMVVLAVKSQSKLGTIAIKSPISSNLEIAKILNKRFHNQTLTILLPEDRVTKLDNWAWLKLNNTPLHLTIGLDKLKDSDIKEQVKTISTMISNQINYSTFKASNPTKQSTTIKRKLKLGIRPKEISQPVYDYIVSEKLYTSVSPSA